MSIKRSNPVPPGSAYAHECPKCGQWFFSNPDDPPSPHKKEDSEEWCIDEEEWRLLVEECP